MDPLDVMDVLRPLLLRRRVSGSVMPEKNGRLTLPRHFLEVTLVPEGCSELGVSGALDAVGGGGEGGGGGGGAQ